MIRILVHPGFHKTGTTSLQRMLQANHDRLGPGIHVALREDMTAVAETARAYSVRQDPVELALFRGLLAAFLAKLRLQDGETLILSSEDLCGHMPGRRGVTSYAAAPELMRCLAEVAEELIGDPLRLEFLFTTRAPRDWLESLHGHLADRGAIAADLGDFSASVAGAEALGDIVDAVAEAVAPWPVHRAPLERSAARPFGPLAPVLDLLGLDDDARKRLVELPPANSRDRTRRPPS
ncbi:hypothetical protein [Ostreiculturibacter nitratireducens]|uniref:hypothetical protein n=1 Tax=Ostreiculturibacter nitratireducens TaxID=3075226 RepID=UPI0031B5BDE6